MGRWGRGKSVGVGLGRVGLGFVEAFRDVVRVAGDLLVLVRNQIEADLSVVGVEVELVRERGVRLGVVLLRCAPAFDFRDLHHGALRTLNHQNHGIRVLTGVLFA